jgi:RimJ/RimL family protein N-acetyltransferase
VAGSRLELLAEKHLPSVARLFDDEGVLRYTRVPDPVPPGWERDWLGFYEEGRREGKREAFAVVDADDGSFLGLALAFGIDREGSSLSSATSSRPRHAAGASRPRRLSF